MVHSGANVNRKEIIVIRINQFNIEPGVYNCQGIRVVVTNIITHEDNGELKELSDPYVVFRDLDLKGYNGKPGQTHAATMMRMSEFKTKFSKSI